MITREDALQRAETWFNGDKPPEERREVGIYEFEDGYVIWVAEPFPEDLSRPPATVGGGMTVIDKATGHVSYWPSLHPEIIAEQYRARRAERG